MRILVYWDRGKGYVPSAIINVFRPWLWHCDMRMASFGWGMKSGGIENGKG